MRLFSIWGVGMVLAGAGAYAAEAGLRQAVCLDGHGVVDNFVASRAQAVATAVFQDAGVGIVWLSDRQCRNTSGNVIRVELDLVVPAGFGPEAMAYALPYAAVGPAIHVFYSRVLRDHRDLPVEVLGYVIAHEIGHVIEGIARHSAEGVMTAHWGLHDYARMKKRQLAFDAQDVRLMHLSLERLAAALTAQAARE